MAELGFGPGVHTHNHFASLLSAAMEPKTGVIAGVLGHLLDTMNGWMFRGAPERRTGDRAPHDSRSKLGCPSHPQTLEGDLENFE